MGQREDDNEQGVKQLGEGRTLRRPVGIEEGECKWSEEQNSDVVENAGRKGEHGRKGSGK